MNRASKRLLTSALLIVTATTFANKSPVERYQVELLIYSHLTPAGVGAEYWPANVSEPYYQKNVVLLKPSSLTKPGITPPLMYLPAENRNLNKAAKKLSTQLPATILYHQAWQVDSKQLRGHHLHFVINNQSPNNFNDPSRDSDYPDERISGYLSIRLTNYFDTDLELMVTEPLDHVSRYLVDDVKPCDKSDNCYFSFNSSRRTRSHTTNYLDHPMYGALLRITSVQKIAR